MKPDDDKEFVTNWNEKEAKEGYTPTAYAIAKVMVDMCEEGDPQPEDDKSVEELKSEGTVGLYKVKE